MELIVCGDVSVTSVTWPWFKSGDPSRVFPAGVLDLFHHADRVIVNLECALTSSDMGIQKKGPCLKGPTETAAVLKKAGVTDCMLSNNHILDYGYIGLRDTLAALDAQKIPYTGIGNNYEDSRRNYQIHQDGIVIGVVDVCEHEYSYATETRMGTRPFDPFETMEDIRRAKRESDYVLVIYHGGKEFCHYPSPRLRKACQEMVRCGADAVLCQHSHCIGCYEQFQGAHILYGQGNFHFVKESKEPGWYEGLIVRLNVTGEGMTFEAIPLVSGPDFLELAQGAQKEKILSDLETRSETLKDGSWLQHWHEFCESMREVYKKAICGFQETDGPDEMQIFSHYLDCEAHTDVWRECFPTWRHTNRY